MHQQDGDTDGDDKLYGASAGTDGTVVLTGFGYDALSESNFAAVKFDDDGEQIWHWKVSDDQAFRPLKLLPAAEPTSST